VPIPIVGPLRSGQPATSTPTSGMRSNPKLTNTLHHGKLGKRRPRHTEGCYLKRVQFSGATNGQFPPGVDNGLWDGYPVSPGYALH